MQIRNASGSSVVLNVVEDEVEGLGVFSVVLNGDRGSAAHSAGLALLVVFALAKPLPDVFSVFDLNNWNVVCLAESLHPTPVTKAVTGISKRSPSIFKFLNLQSPISCIWGLRSSQPKRREGLPFCRGLCRLRSIPSRVLLKEMLRLIRFLPSLAMDFLITSLMASLMLSLFSSSTLCWTLNLL